MHTGQHEPRQARSHRTLERILKSSTELLAEQSYDEISIAEIAARAGISVGGFYARFQNKEALLDVLLQRLEQETYARLEDAETKDWSDATLLELLHHIVSGNADLFQKYRGVLAVVFLRTRLSQPPQGEAARRAYNEELVRRLESLLLVKRDEIVHDRPRPALRVAIACMSAMLRDAIVFQDASLYAKAAEKKNVARTIATVMYHYLAAKPN